MHYMKLIPKSFRFTEEDLSMIEQIRFSKHLSKNVDVIRRAISIMFNQIQGNTEMSVVKPVVQTQVKNNPYVGWVIMPNPDGNTKPFFSEYHGFTMLEIANPKPPFQKVVLKEGGEWYDYFIN